MFWLMSIHGFPLKLPFNSLLCKMFADIKPLMSMKGLK